MSRCASDQDFFRYFKENMEALGLPVPSSAFGTQAQAAATISAMLAAIKSFGKTATVAELIGATSGLEKLAVVGALSASFYVGAAIGSLAVAAGRYAACGATIADVIFELVHNGWSAPWLHAHIAAHPEIVNSRVPGRSAYAARASVAVSR